MTPRVEDQEPKGAPMSNRLSTDPYHVIAQEYDNNIGQGLNFLGYSMEDMIHYIYIPSWEEKLDECGGGTGMSGANQDGDDKDD